MCPKQDSMEHMRTTWDAMLLAAATYEGDIKSSSGLVGGDGQTDGGIHTQYR